MDWIQALISRYPPHKFYSGRTAIYVRRRFGDIIQLMKEIVALIHKTNVTELYIDGRFVYWKSHSQARECFDINVFVIGRHW